MFEVKLERNEGRKYITYYIPKVWKMGFDWIDQEYITSHFFQNYHRGKSPVTEVDRQFLHLLVELTLRCSISGIKALISQVGQIKSELLNISSLSEQLGVCFK